MLRAADMKCRRLCCVIAACLNVVAVIAYDVHVSTSDRPGTVIVNASLGPGWRYRFDRPGSDVQGLSSVHLHPSLGLVILRRPLSVSCVGSQPFIMSVTATTAIKPGNATLIPLRVFVHGRNCHLKQKYVHRPLHREQLIESYVGLCLNSDSDVLSVSHFIPIAWSHCKHEYSIVDHGRQFSIDSLTGNIRTTVSLCLTEPYETLRGEINVTCEHSFTFPFKILLHPNHRTVSDLHDDHQRLRRSVQNTPPSFPQGLYTKNVPEEQRPGFVIDTITAVDPDADSAGVLTYSLLATRDGRSQDMFVIDASTGQLTTTRKLDRETMATHYFSLIATDQGSPPQSGVASLTINVDDINDHAPAFESANYSLSVLESVDIGSTIVTVRASDEDSGPNAKIHYSIVDPMAVNGMFRIHPRRGSITTRLTLDREQQDFYRFNVQAVDNALVTDRKTATTVVEITVLDVNDNRPQFTKNSYTIEINEDIDPSAHPVIAQISATDADAGANGNVRYSIRGGNVQEVFVIDTLTGKLSILRALDYEHAESYKLSIRAQDSGRPKRSNTTTVLIRVLDINDNAPKFYPTLYQKSVVEDVPIGYSILYVQAYDDDSGRNAQLRYSIKGTPGNFPMKIDSTTGVLRTTRRLDREHTPRYAFDVQVVDLGTPALSAMSRVEITLRDVNDNAPIFDPRTYRHVLAEETNPGTLVIMVTAHDADEEENARVTYAITAGNERHAFSIISQMGQGLITLAKTLNYKEQSRYILTVTASDTGSLLDTATVFINISDANTHYPEFVGTPYMVHVDEDKAIGKGILVIHAKDDDEGDNARITYTLDPSDVFQIDPDTGEMSVKQPLDRESIAGYTVSVTATDHGRPTKSDTTDVEIIVDDVNDNSPKFLKGAYRGQIVEGAPIGTSLLTVSAIDADVSLNGRIRYTFEGGNSGNGDFALDPTLGILRSAKEIDRERTATYELVAYAVDRGTPEKSTSVVISIEVEDINDNRPEFPLPQMTLFIPENSPIGTTVGTIEATDSDEGPNAKVNYSIAGGLDAASFRLSAKPNEPAKITSLIELDYEGSRKEYHLIIRARSFHLFSDLRLTIKVQDVNDNIPLMEDFVIIFNNFKNHFPTGPIGKIPATDPDEHDELKYRFIEGNRANILRLDERTGYITLDSRLNSDVPTNATMRVSVSDGINIVKATCRLFVRLVTKDMLHNSLTVRLNAIDHAGFLSPLYSLFLSALATVVPTTEDNIFIINVQDDTEVASPEKILNVSFSVHQQVRHSRDVFYSPQFLKERIYLQRMLLAKLSTLEVLPFNDDLCVREPCLNFEECLSVLKFGNASSFLSSSTMLFRPIHPINAFRCNCPAGFTGMETEYLCDTEVNLCYSGPCRHNGTCVRREGGYICQCTDAYTGDHCEVERRTQKYSVCPPGVCKGAHTRCTPLIRGGFRCELCADGDLGGDTCRDCAALDHHTPFCELTTRSFPRGSFLMYPSLRRRHRFNIRIKFATRERNGLLFYNGRYNEKHDFVAMEIINGQVQFSFSLGNDITRVTAHHQGGVSDGKWHEVNIGYLNRTATLSVGESCDTIVSIKYGRRIGNYSCAARATQVLEARCTDVTESCHRFLDLTGPLQLGGLPTLSADFQVRNKHFVGCLQDVYIDEKFLDLNDFVWDAQTVAGCDSKRQFCVKDVCKHGGICNEAWDTYQCVCQEKWGGKDCSQKIGPRRKLVGTGYISYVQHRLPNVRFPWYNGVSFRTRHPTALLMSVQVGDNVKVKIELVNGVIRYVHPRKTVTLDSAPVNDGQWHYVEARWLTDELILALDYGQIQTRVPMGKWVLGERVGEIVVGGQPQRIQSRDIVLNGLKGCIENARVGNNPNSVLDNLKTSPREYHVAAGCSQVDPCNTYPCPSERSYCNNEWQAHSCSCFAGRMGPRCERVCTHYNPCDASATCRDWPSSIHGYTCVCPRHRSGQYCEQHLDEVCPATWWGHPICGPCNCPTRRGFDHSCDKVTGECYCKENYYRRPGSDTCLPCNCYMDGSYSTSCDTTTGQCRCRSGVISRQCNQCESRFAQVTTRGCEVVYDACPTNYKYAIWWLTEAFGQMARYACPLGSVGMATRYCDEKYGWLEPDVSACTSTEFVTLAKELEKLEGGGLKVNTFVSQTVAASLNATVVKTDKLNSYDVYATCRLVTHILRYESRQSGLNMTHTQDRNFIQNIVNTVGAILDPSNAAFWASMHNRSSGAMELIVVLEAYTVALARNAPQLFTQPFDAVHPNLMLGIDYMDGDNISVVTVPKYNNKVADPDMFDRDTHVLLPESALPNTATGLTSDVDTKPVLAYLMFRTIGDILPQHFDSSVRVGGSVPVSVNSPVFTMNVVVGNRTVTTLPAEPIRLDFRVLVTKNRSSPQCVFWKPSSDGGQTGQWSTDGCAVISRRTVDDHDYVTCECGHLTSFGVLMDRSNIEFLGAGPVSVEIITYVCFSITLLCLIVSFFIFRCLPRLSSNSNSIHINVVLSIFITLLVYLIGIDQVNNRLACKMVSIVLHYFCMCLFAWMFVDALHIYRMMTEIRDINHGAMKFYYVVGYVIPGIIVGLSVGLDTDNYGNSRFCWLATPDLVFWSFAGPVLIAFMLNIIVFAMATRVSCCRAKDKDDSEFEPLLNGLKAGLVLLPLLGVAWVFAVLAVNDDIMAFHYLFAIFTFFYGVFILIAYVLLDKNVRRQVKYAWFHLQGRKGYEDSPSPTRNSMLSRSALSYHQNDSSLEGGLSRVNVGISTSSTTSRSTTSKSGGRGGLYHPDAYLHSSSTSTNPNTPYDYPPNAGIAPYGYDSSGQYHSKPVKDDPDTGEMDRKRRIDSDSDSDLSALGNPDLDLASSHSSDDDDDDDNFAWDSVNPQQQQSKASESPTKKKRPSGHSEAGIRNPDQVKVTAPKKAPEKPSQRNILKGSKENAPSPSDRPDSLLPTKRTKVKLPREQVPVLTHNGSITSDSDCSNDSYKWP